MGFDAGFNAGFNPNIQQPNQVNKNADVNNVEKNIVKEVKETTSLDLKNTVDVNFGIAKTASGLTNVNIFEQKQSAGTAAMSSVADNIGDLNKGAIQEAAKMILNSLRNAV